jgi:hypothetical protein
MVVLVVLVVSEAGCRTPKKEPTDTERAEQRVWAARGPGSEMRNDGAELK